MKSIFINSYLKKYPIIETTLLDFYKFLKKPNDEQIELNLKDKIIFVLILLTIEIIILVILVLPVFYLIDQILILKETKLDYDFTLIDSLVLIVLIIPLFEEFIFRYFLRYKGQKTESKHYNKWNRHFPYRVYIFSIVFGILHITNYSNNNFLFYLLSPFLVISQLSGGFVLSFIRVRLNFFYGFLFHAFWNLLFVIVVPSVQSVFKSPTIENNKIFSIKIEEKLFFDNDDPRFFRMDIKNGKINALNIQQFSIQHILDSIYEKDKYYVEDALINLNLKSKHGLKKEEILKILKKEFDISIN